MDSGRSARILLLLAAVLFSTGGAVIKLMSFTGWQVACLRSLVAALVLWLLLPQARRGWSASMLGVALCFAATMIFYVLANKLTTAANAIFLQSTAPLYLLILGPVVLREGVQKVDLVLMGILATGLVLLLSGQEAVTSTTPDPQLGNVFAACAGVSWALTVLGLRWQSRKMVAGQDPALACVVAGNLIACVVAGTMAFPLPVVHAVDWALLAYLGAAQIGLAYVFMTRGIRRVTALQASLLLLLEPVLSPIWAWAVHGEQPSVAALGGGAMILLATAVSAVRKAPDRELPA
jgi:DME family drug/metabolite transporter